MFTFKSSEDVLSLSEFRTTLSARVEQIRRTGRPLLLTQNGRTTGIFIGAAEWDALQEKLERLEAYEDILVAEGEADRGETVGHEEVMREMRVRRAARTRRILTSSPSATRS